MAKAAPVETRHVRTTALFALAGVLLTGAAFAVGISDNPPGIALCYGASAAFVLALAHPWRRPSRWLALAGVSVVAGVAFAILHNFPEVAAQRMADSPMVGGALGVIGATLFVLAVLVAPAAIVVGLGGGVVTALRHRAKARHVA